MADTCNQSTELLEQLCKRIIDELEKVVEFYRKEKKYTSGYATSRHKCDTHYVAKENFEKADVFSGILAAKLKITEDYEDSEQVMETLIQEFERQFEPLDRYRSDTYDPKYKFARIIEEIRNELR